MVKMFRKIRNIHFIGIGGSGMCGIAELLLNLGYPVSGSDMVESERTIRLQKAGGRIYFGHNAQNVENAEVVVVSSAIDETNPEVKRARDLMIPIIPRAGMLAELMRLKYGIAVAGAHGKTTTTSLIATLLHHGGLDPTAVIGGKLNSFGSNAKLGQGEFLVAEADESDGSFLKLTPTIGVVTNLDMEHLDHYGSMDAIKDAFLSFLNKVPFYGVSILCIDEPYLQSIMPGIKTRYLTYGMSQQADFRAIDIFVDGWNTEFNVIFEGNNLGRFKLTMPGEHNVYNALAAIAVAVEMDIDPEDIIEGLSKFTGVERRMEFKGEVNEITVVDDYGHHPTEVRASLKALKKSVKQRLLVVFQPHRYSRTRDHLEHFANSFNEADQLFMLDIYPAGEKPIEGISAENLAEKIKQCGNHNVNYFQNKNDAIDAVIATAGPGDFILTLGAGDIYKLGDLILDRLK